MLLTVCSRTNYNMWKKWLLIFQFEFVIIFFLLSTKVKTAVEIAVTARPL